MSKYEVRDFNCSNPAVLRDGTINLSIGTIYKVFCRNEHHEMFYVGHDNKILTLIEIVKNIDNSWGIPHLTEFQFLLDNEIKKMRLGADEDYYRFYFEEIKDEI